jgi:hypothetical protein
MLALPNEVIVYVTLQLNYRDTTALACVNSRLHTICTDNETWLAKIPSRHRSSNGRELYRRFVVSGQQAVMSSTERRDVYRVDYDWYFDVGAAVMVTYIGECWLQVGESSLLLSTSARDALVMYLDVAIDIVIQIDDGLLLIELDDNLQVRHEKAFKPISIRELVSFTCDDWLQVLYISNEGELVLSCLIDGELTRRVLAEGVSSAFNRWTHTLYVSGEAGCIVDGKRPLLQCRGLRRFLSIGSNGEYKYVVLADSYDGDALFFDTAQVADVAIVTDDGLFILYKDGTLYKHGTTTPYDVDVLWIRSSCRTTFPTYIKK